MGDKEFFISILEILKSVLISVGVINSLYYFLYVSLFRLLIYKDLYESVHTECITQVNNNSANSKKSTDKIKLLMLKALNSGKNAFRTLDCIKISGGNRSSLFDACEICLGSFFSKLLVS